MAQAANLTVTFRSEPEGIAIGQFPSLDGSNNDLTGQLRGKVGDRYSRLVPPDYCPWDENSDSVSDLDGEPRCITHLGKYTFIIMQISHFYQDIDHKIFLVKNRQFAIKIFKISVKNLRQFRIKLRIFSIQDLGYFQ